MSGFSVECAVLESCMLHSERSGSGKYHLERSVGAQVLEKKVLEKQVLEDGLTCVWWIDLQVAPEIVDSGTRLLSSEERSRAHRIARNDLYREFVVTRSAVRLLLASYIGCAPDKLRLVTGRYGKLAVDEVGAGIEFNVSHSHGLALICLSRDRHVGVDLEYIRNMSDLDLMIALALTTGEQAAISADPEPLETFFRCWVRKEAIVKAAGVGLSASLRDVDVTTSDGPVKVQLGNVQDRLATYEATDLEAPHGYKAAIACEWSIGDLVVKKWT
jgi:4'-phosphopantetheinyl transferase